MCKVAYFFKSEKNVIHRAILLQVMITLNYFYHVFEYIGTSKTGEKGANLVDQQKDNSNKA